MAKNSILTLEDLAESTAHTLSFEGDYNTSQEERFFRIEPNGSGRFTLTLETRPAESATQEEVPLGEEQAIFSQWSRIKDREMGNFSWEKSDSSSLFMDEYTDFVDQILHSRIPLVMGKKGKELSKSSLRKGQVNLNISGTSGEEELSSSLTFHTEGRELRNPRILSPRHILIKDTVYSCFPGLGMNYSLLKQFEGRIKKRDLESYLSLFSSLFPNREIHYEDYYFYQTGITESAERGLRFTSLDEEGNLHLSLLWNLPPFSPKFINTSRPTQKITIDHKTRRVASTRISYQDSRELALTKLLQKYTKEKMSLHDEDFYLPAEQALPFLTENLSRLAGNFTLFGTEELETYKLKHLKPLPHIHLSSGIDFFEGQCEIELGPDRIPLNLALKLYEENNYIPLTDGTKAIVEKKFFDKLIRILGKTDKENRVKLSFFDLPLVDMIIEEKTEEKGFVKYREIFEGFNKINSRRLKKDLIQGELRDYQKYGVKWFNYLKENRLGGCLADDMGLGKTVQTISLLTADYKQNEAAPSSLIIMPRSLLTNWQRELEKFAPQLSVCLYYGPERNLAEALKHQIILTTYSLVRNDIEQLHGTPFRFLILDEIQAIKNIHSRIAKAVMLLEGTYRFGLSGTPMENHVGEIYSIFRFLNPTMFGSLNDFSRRYLNPIQKKNDPHAAELLGKKLSPFILRRLKQDVASELPPRTEQILYAEMDKDQAALYEDRRHFYEQTIKSAIGTEGFAKAGFMILQGLLELRQLASIPEIKTEGKIVSPKWSVFLDHMAEVIEGGHRCLVFTNFLSTVEILSQKLEEKGIDHLVMTGSTTNRAELVDRFQSSQRQKVFLMTLKTGGVGLNLTGADYVYILDPWWNRSAEQQAIDRTHRIGQTKSIFSYRVISRGTIEEKILQLQERKKQLFSSLISSDGQLMKKLTEEDIDFLLNDRSAL